MTGTASEAVPETLARLKSVLDSEQGRFECMATTAMTAPVDEHVVVAKACSVLKPWLANDLPKSTPNGRWTGAREHRESSHGIGSDLGAGRFAAAARTRRQRAGTAETGRGP